MFSAKSLVQSCIKESSNYAFNHGLRMPNEAFFHQNPKLLSLGRQFGPISFGVFSADLSAPILVCTVTPLSMFSINQTLIPNIYLGLGLGFEFEFGPQRIRDLAIVCPYSVHLTMISSFDPFFKKSFFILLVIVDPQ
jgi:hypothetical protein